MAWGGGIQVLQPQQTSLSVYRGQWFTAAFLRMWLSFTSTIQYHFICCTRSCISCPQILFWLIRLCSSEPGSLFCRPGTCWMLFCVTSKRNNARMWAMVPIWQPLKNCFKWSPIPLRIAMINISDVVAAFGFSPPYMASKVRRIFPKQPVL